MLTTIEIDQDVHHYLLSKVTRFGESASDVLRRELNLGDRLIITAEDEAGRRSGHEFSNTLESPEFQHSRGVVGKFLHLLSVVHAANPSKFERVLTIRGRGRIYFATSKDDIEKSGNSTQPRQIPDSPYWVMTNSPTNQKKEMLRDVLSGLGYSEKSIMEATKSIE